MNPNTFYGNRQRRDIPRHLEIPFPVEFPDLSDVSDLSSDSDEDFEVSESEVVAAGADCNIEDAVTDSESESGWPDDDSDNQQSQRGSKKQQHQKQRTSKTNLVWKVKKLDEVHRNDLPFECDDEVVCHEILEPIEYVRKFLTDEMLQHICDESNKYAVQNNPDRPLVLDKDELEQFIGILYMISIVKMPSTRLYWSQEFYFGKIADIMTINRFEKIKSCLHCNDNMQRPSNCTNKLYKLQPIIDMLKDSFSSLRHEEMLCIDEQVVPFKGMSSLKQYNPQKPKKWGYKFYVLSGVDGLIHNFEIHAGPIGICPGQPDLKASGNIVLHLLVNVPRHKWHKLFFDNWYTGIELVKVLYTQGIACVGTVRANRLPNIKLPTDSAMKAQGRGAAALYVTKVDNIELRAVKWFDNRGVTLLSTYEAINPVSTVERWDRKTKTKVQVSRPAIVSTYNKFMGGVDLLDSMLSLYRIHIRSKKWYHRLLWHFFDMIMVQAWLIYCQEMKRINAPKKEVLQLRVFKMKAASDLTKCGKMIRSKRGHPSTSFDSLYNAKKKRGPTAPIPEKSTRTDNTGHFPTFVEQKGRCKYPGCGGIPKVLCEKCKVHLCFTPKSNCFKKFHL